MKKDCYGIPIAFVIHSLDHSLFARLRDLYRTGSLSRSLFSHLIAIRSLDPTLQIH